MNPHIPLKDSPEPPPNGDTGPVLVGSKPSPAGSHNSGTVADSSAISSRFNTRARRATIVASVVFMIAATAALGYRFWNERANRPKPMAGESAVGADWPAKVDALRDTSPQVVTLSAESIRKYGLRIGTARKRLLISQIVAPRESRSTARRRRSSGSPFKAERSRFPCGPAIASRQARFWLKSRARSWAKRRAITSSGEPPPPPPEPPSSRSRKSTFGSRNCTTKAK